MTIQAQLQFNQLGLALEKLSDPRRMAFHRRAAEVAQRRAQAVAARPWRATASERKSASTLTAIRFAKESTAWVALIALVAGQL